MAEAVRLKILPKDGIAFDGFESHASIIRLITIYEITPILVFWCL
jgi:hypothetical protein